MDKKIFFAATALMASGLCLSAQDTDFDLSSQRLESQTIAKVPGHKIDHKGLVINPVPHTMNLNGEKSHDLSSGFSVKDRKGAFSNDLGFLKTDKKGIPLTIDFGEKAAAKAGVRSAEGAYSLSVSDKGVKITGFDERGAFYGLQTLRQVLESGKLPYMEINDWPDLKYRGVVEGFYGTPWSHEVRISLIDFYGQNKMNTYLYGPKDDPYHSCPNWRLPYPEDEARNIGELVKACERNRVDFVWAIHPGQDIKWNEEDYGNLLNKFNLMYDLGVRSFAIFFDDISGEGTNPTRQAELLNRLNSEFVKVKGDVRPLIVCPTDYSRLWANPGPNGNLSIYGKILDPSIEVFWTGDYVCSDLTEETMEWVNTRIKRPAFYWWNFPVTDYARHIIMQGPAYGLDKSLTGDDLCGIVSNPMEHGEASKIALYGVADYSWNIAGYNPLDNWERGLAELVPDATDAYRTFAIHSCDTETGYRRSESWETETFLVDNYTEEQYDALMAEFRKIREVPGEMEEGCANGLLLDELRPWLTEFGKLGVRGEKALELVKVLEDGDYAAFWPAYTENLMTQEELDSYNAHKCGTLKLQPFYENAMDDLGVMFFESLSGERSSVMHGMGSFNNSFSTQTKLMFDNDSTTYYTSGVAQSKGSWIGVDLGSVIPVKEIFILQGRNSVDDVDYFDHAALQYSEDGKTWKTLLDDMQKQYVIRWCGDPVQARFVRLQRLDSKKQNWASVRTFEVNPVKAEDLGFQLEASDLQAAVKAFDKNIQSFYRCNGSLTAGIPAGTASLTVLTGDDNCTLEIVQYAEDGSEICSSTVDGAFSEVELNDGAVKVTAKGQADIYEIIFND
ncbi:MAG: beta-N-acetylglucosaminidase domain-containing protein [Bacteroidetes bacterium]|uniref:Beta-N-acetylglucosaminidase domain-containing protein n=1 Tax=Candidatus Cryptobacteroides excrementipullorum TaxID=2840761 RepID=A0A9D9NKW1_9BACT|nr:beta-N-acetylglucosaminidase domain-containing protein [Candidatus Cryptobacteroides excrementipullorum]